MPASAVGTAGFGFGLAYPVLLNKMAEVANSEFRTLAVMLMTAFANIGQFISPLITNGIQSAFHIGSIQGVFFSMMMMIVVVFMITACINLKGIQIVYANRKSAKCSSRSGQRTG
ncbi:hypothetical protein [Paenibacillus sp. Root444D2]|uniref:hypothetical protein n=1 Tax=Paenibacillus sp. Root444D2 TaxID=1736538 RepID=UPI00070DA5D6|nr:hypothetical protein [Paenibacillus sp. Root444D2]KQX44651.1 hypothetical protein ASD40_21895 [Paenibacillus sp. Root444D2]